MATVYPVGWARVAAPGRPNNSWGPRRDGRPSPQPKPLARWSLGGAPAPLRAHLHLLHLLAQLAQALHPERPLGLREHLFLFLFLRVMLDVLLHHAHLRLEPLIARWH